MKTCVACGETKPLSEYYARVRYGAVRPYARCKECLKAYERDRYEPHPRPKQTAEEKKVWVSRWQKANRDKMTRWARVSREKKLDQYKAKETEYYHRSKEQKLQQARLWRDANREVVRLYSKAATQARRAKGWRHDLKAIRLAIQDCLESYRIGDQYWDVYESRLIDEPTIDHIVPLSAGGSHTSDNFCITSVSSNSQKSDAPLIVWLAKRAALLKSDGS
jgi:5-methylcytosine-specific restriction endonuclease McrA